MKKKIIILYLFLFSGCGKLQDFDATKNKEKAQLLNTKSGSLSQKSSIIVDIKCVNVYPDGSDWSQEQVKVDNKFPSIELIKDKNCSILLKEYINEQSSFKPQKVDLPLSININGDGSSKPSATAVYTTIEEKPQILYFASYNVAPFSFVINSAADPAAAKQIAPSIIPTTLFKADFTTIDPPDVQNLQFISLPKTNDNPPENTLYGSVTGSIGCKMIKFDEKLNPVPTTWELANTQYNSKENGVNVFECVKLNKKNNWNDFIANKMIIIWANSSEAGRLNAYTVAVIKPNTVRDVLRRN